ncbi:MAG: ATP-binding protein [Bacillota bacterium]|nr:ATP-binding protein [Bacillota bacterium]
MAKVRTLRSALVWAFMVTAAASGGLLFWLGSAGRPWPWGFSLLLLLSSLAGAAGYLIAEEFARPLRQLVASARELGRGRFGKMVWADSGGEVGELVDAFNAMAVYLERTVQELAETNRKLEAILTSMENGVIVVGRNLEVLRLNPAACRLFELPEEAVKGKGSVIQLIRNYEVADAFAETLETGTPVVRELQILTPVERSLRIHITPIRSEQGEVEGAVGVLSDISDLRRLERIRADFVANVSHELRTPLTSLKGYAETLLDGALDDPPTARRFLEVIQQEADRMARLISDLLDLTHLEARGQTIVKSPVRIEEVVENSLRVVRPAAEKKGIRLEVDLPSDLPVLWANADMLEQVLINLLDNAVKYTPEGGEVKVAVRAGRGVMHISVADTGIGIPREHLGRLFERFYRVDRARSRSLGGTGLGLAIVKHIVERHGGSVGVESAVGRGSTFTVTLPLKD